MIERHVTFDVLPDRAPEFERFFLVEYRPAMASMRGFEGVELLQEKEQPNHYHMVIRFDSTEDAAAWRASEAHKALQPHMKVLYSSSELSVYNVVA